MSREIRRVPLDFNYPLDKTWDGYLHPANLRPDECGVCRGDGMSPYAKHLRSMWYGNAPFDPASKGSKPFTYDNPAVWAFSKRQIENSPEYYGEGALAILRNANRLCRLFNAAWSHHLSQEEVDVLVTEGKPHDLLNTWTKGVGWEPIVPTPTLTAEFVNQWSISNQLFGIGGSELWTLMDFYSERDSQPLECGHCDDGYNEAYPGQQADIDAWEPTPPPVGDAYQLWQTISEGGPASPPFATPEELADWIRAHGRDNDGRNSSREGLITWIREEGSSIGSGVHLADGTPMSGVDAAIMLRGQEV